MILIAFIVGEKRQYDRIVNQRVSSSNKPSHRFVVIETIRLKKKKQREPSNHKPKSFKTFHHLSDLQKLG
jgi:hypothetical protein